MISKLQKKKKNPVFILHQLLVIAECVPAILLQSLKILAVMAAIRLDNTADQIENVLSSSLMGAVPAVDPLASNTWEEVIVGVRTSLYIHSSIQNTRMYLLK
jgi:cytolysin (calcineurin-like family phosphatase)